LILPLPPSSFLPNCSFPFSMAFSNPTVVYDYTCTICGAPPTYRYLLKRFAFDDPDDNEVRAWTYSDYCNCFSRVCPEPYITTAPRTKNRMVQLTCARTGSIVMTVAHCRAMTHSCSLRRISGGWVTSGSLGRRWFRMGSRLLTMIIR
jgi:hypothetical protein